MKLKFTCLLILSTGIVISVLIASSVKAGQVLTKHKTAMDTTTKQQNGKAGLIYQKHYQTINGARMAYIDAGKGDPIIFLHGNPASSFIWRNIIPYVQQFGRCIAPDLVGMGDSEKLRDKDDYTFANNEKYLNGLFQVLGLNRNIIFVMHDWGSVLAIDWARKHPGAVKGIVYMEALTRPRSWEEVPPIARETFQKLRSEQGEAIVLQQNSFIEFNLPKTILRSLSAEEMDEYRRPFKEAGESRRVMLSWARQLPLGDEPLQIVKIVNDNSEWMRHNTIPKLFIEAMPGTLAREEKEACLAWPNQIHITVNGHHNLQEDSPKEIGTAISVWLQSLNSLIPPKSAQ